MFKYEVELGIRNLDRTKKFSFIDYTEEVLEAAENFNLKSKNSIDIDTIRAKKESILFNLCLEEETNRPLKKLMHFSRYMMSTLGEFCLVENKLFKLIYFKELNNSAIGKSIEILSARKLRIINKIIENNNELLIEEIEKALEKFNDM